MFSTLRTRFGIPGVISVIALVFAMFGGAYAASNSSGGGKATASAKAKKGPRGPKGATGPAGPAGPAGLAGAKGADGAQGSQGEQGEQGQNGTNGTNGKSVTVAAENTGTGNCGGRGGSSFETVGSGVKQYACNGEAGAQGEQGLQGPAGPEGVCSSADCTLPASVPLKGTWSVNFQAAEAGESIFVPISFNIPVSSPLGPFFYMKEGETEDTKSPESQCKGGAGNPEVQFSPSAPSGQIVMCVFASKENNFAPTILINNIALNKLGASKAGSIFEAKSTGVGVSSAYGTWVVMVKP